jgi:hypothetical protein
MAKASCPLRRGSVEDLFPLSGPGIIYLSGAGISLSQAVQLDAHQPAAPGLGPIQERLVVRLLVPGDIVGEYETRLTVEAEIEVARFKGECWEGDWSDSGGLDLGGDDSGGLGMDGNNSGGSGMGGNDCIGW